MTSLQRSAEIKNLWKVKKQFKGSYAGLVTTEPWKLAKMFKGAHEQEPLHIDTSHFDCLSFLKSSICSVPEKLIQGQL